jgi:Ca-activated chloride channel family protein
MTLTRFLSLLVILIVTTSVTFAQDDEDVIRTSTDNVVLNLTVTDKSGQYVKGLKRGDFKLYIDGIEADPSTIAGFSFQEAPYAAVLLLDSSGSMEERFSLARSAAIRFLDGLRPEDVTAVYRFDSKVERVQDFSGVRDLAPTAYAIRASGMTTLNDAIVKAAEVLASRNEHRKAIVILSDGMDTKSSASSDKAVERALAIGASIYAVDMSQMDVAGSRKQSGAASLKSFAEKTGGRFVATPGGPALRDAFTGIADELGHQYTLSYRPTDPHRDGKWHTIEVKVEVKVNREEAKVRTRKGFRVPKRN